MLFALVTDWDARDLVVLKVEAMRRCSVPPTFYPEATLPGKPRSHSSSRHYIQRKVAIANSRMM